MNRPPLISFRVAAVMAMVAAVRPQIEKMPAEIRIRRVDAAISPSTRAESSPQPSATEMTSYPSSSARRAASRITLWRTSIGVRATPRRGLVMPRGYAPPGPVESVVLPRPGRFTRKRTALTAETT